MGEEDNGVRRLRDRAEELTAAPKRSGGTRDWLESGCADRWAAAVGWRRGTRSCWHCAAALRLTAGPVCLRKKERALVLCGRGWCVGSLCQARGCHACGRAGALLARLLGRDSWALGVGLAWANGLGWEEGLLVGLVTGLGWVGCWTVSFFLSFSNHTQTI